MGKNYKPPVKMFIVFLALCIILGYYISGVFTYPNVSLTNVADCFTDVVSHPLRNYFNDKTLPCIGMAFVGWIFFIVWYITYNRNFMSNREHGSSKWADTKNIQKTMTDPVLENNRILSQNVKVGLQGKLSNNNIFFVGAPGKGKSFNSVAPNILLANASFVIMDVKGELLLKYGSFLKHRGYQIRVLNLKEMEKSNQYNPFTYMEREEDIPKLIMGLLESIEPPDAHKGDPFWDEGCQLYLQALFYYEWIETPKERRSMNNILRLCNMENRIVDVDDEGVPFMDDLPHTELEVELTRVARNSSYGLNHPAFRDYYKLKGGAPDTVRSIILMINSKFKFFEIQGVKRIFEDDEMHLEELGTGKNYDEETKTALFLVMPANDNTFNFMTALIYQQIFDVAIRVAEKRYRGALPIRIDVWMDEFANGSRPAAFEKLITTLRSYNIAVMMMLQSVGQVKTIYKNDAWDILFDSCSTFVFLGGGRAAYNTCKYVSDLLGTGTIDKRADSIAHGKTGNSNISFDRLGRALMTPEEVSTMPKGEVIILLEGKNPIRDKKYNPLQDANFQEAMALGDYIHYVQVKKHLDGSYETLNKSEGQLYVLNEKASENFNGRTINITEDDFLSIDFDSFADESRNLNEQLINQMLSMESRQQIIRMTDSKIEENRNTWNLNGSIKEVIQAHGQEMTQGQLNEVVLGLQHGLTEAQVKSYLIYSEGKMRALRELIELEQSI